MENKITFATVGTSWITHEFILAADETAKWKYAGAYSRDTEKAKDFAKIHNAGFSCSSLEELAQKSGAEAIYIASPNSLHVQQARFFIENGKHVICEKPLSGSYDEMRGIFNLAETKNVFLIEAFRHINSPGFKKLSESLYLVSPLRICSLSYNQYSSRYPAYLRGENPNIFNPGMGGGALMDIGIYPLSLSIALFGEPSGIKSSLHYLPNGADAFGAVILDYDSFIVPVTFSKVSNDAVKNQFSGENGAIVVDKSPELSEVYLVDNDGNRKELETPHEHIYFKHKMASEANVFANIILNNDIEKYEELKKISLQTCKLIETIFKLQP